MCLLHGVAIGSANIFCGREALLQSLGATGLSDGRTSYRSVSGIHSLEQREVQVRWNVRLLSWWLPCMKMDEALHNLLMPASGDLTLV